MKEILTEDLLAELLLSRDPQEFIENTTSLRAVFLNIFRCFLKRKACVAST